MGNRVPVVAHVIVGAKPEAYLSASLESIADVCDHAVINDTSRKGDNPNVGVVNGSRFAREGRLTLVRSPFTNFAAARNVCIDSTPEAFASGWGMTVDADEVHGDALASMSALLPHLPDNIDAVDGFLRHFVGSFSWWVELSRTRCFFRMAPDRRWQGAVHERVIPLRQRIALAATWFHYGHVVTPREEAEKSRLYASLGQPGPAPDEAQLNAATAARVWRPLLRKANSFHGRHPRAAQSTIDAISLERAALFAEVDSLAAEQTTIDRLRNTLRRLNAGRLVAWRALEARLRWGWRNDGSARAIGVLSGERT